MADLYKEKIKIRNKELEAQISRLHQDEEKIIKSSISNGCKKGNITKEECLYSCKDREKCVVNKELSAKEEEIKKLIETINKSETLVNNPMWD